MLSESSNACSSYKEEFQNQYNQYIALYSLFLQSPGSNDEESVTALHDFIDFIAHVANCYPDLTSEFPGQLIELLASHHKELQQELREKIIGSLVLLRKKDIIDSSTLINTLFPILLYTPSKSLRSLVFQKILSDIRNTNSKTTNHKLNRSVQILLYNLLTSDRSSPRGLWAVKLTRELWKRQIWTDAKAVGIMKEAALSDEPKVVMGGVRFFLGGDAEREAAAEESSDEEGIDMGKLKHQAGINKKSRKKDQALKKAASTLKKRERKKNAPHPLNFSALHLLHDPQGFAETLFSRHLQSTKSKLNLEQKLLVLQLVSRLVGLHQLTIISLYSYLIKYLTPRQPSVTSFLASLAQSTHSFVPPDTLSPLLHKIANEFVSEASSSEVCTAGLNAIREICARQPLAMDETLLQDLVMYRKSKDKGVVMASKGLMSLYREKAPEMLKRTDRGKEAAMGLRAGEKGMARFGEVQAGTIEGIELLEAYKEEERRKWRAEQGMGSDAEDDHELDEAEEEAGWENWEAESDESDDSGGWINVESDGEEIDISDSEDEKVKDKPPPAKKAKLETDIDAQTRTQSEAREEFADEAGKLSKLASTRILTPADLAKLNELKTQAGINALLPGHKTHHKRPVSQTATTRHHDDPLTAEEIEGLANFSKKATKEERVAMAKGDRETKHQSTTAMRKEKKRAEGKSTTNKEKARQKNFLMTLGKAKSKNKRSLVEVRKGLRGHVERAKRGGRRGNR